MSVVKEPIITCLYGVKRKLPDGREDIHTGVDIISKIDNRTVYSPVEGYVAYDFDDYCHIKRYEKPNTGGNMVIITAIIDGVTYHVRFLHLVKNYVRKGFVVIPRMAIGEYGDVGYSFGAHLHLDVYDSTWTHKINPAELGIV